MPQDQNITIKKMPGNSQKSPSITHFFQHENGIQAIYINSLRADYCSMPEI